MERKALGFTLVEIMIVVAIIGILASIAIPNFVKARRAAQKTACINNLRQLTGAKEQWALEHSKPDTATPGLTDLFSVNNGYLKKLPVCPLDGTYDFGNVATKPTCNFGTLEGHTL